MVQNQRMSMQESVRQFNLKIYILIVKENKIELETTDI